MAISIGSLTFPGWSGTLQGKQASLSTFTRPGVVGTGIAVDAQHALTSEIETRAVDTKANCVAGQATAESYVGTIVSVVDHLGTTWNHCAILGVQTRIQKITGTGASDHVITFNWQILADSV